MASNSGAARQWGSAYHRAGMHKEAHTSPARTPAQIAADDYLDQVEETCAQAIRQNKGYLDMLEAVNSMS